MCSLQDEKGFLWLGTKDGLNRFDGNSFKIFRHADEDSNTIGNDYIRCLYLDGASRMYVGTQRGLYQFHPRTESFSHIKASENKSIKEVREDGYGNVWFIAEGTLFKLSTKTKQVKRYDSETFFRATSMCLTPDGNLWIATEDGLLKKYFHSNDSFLSFDVFSGIPATNKWIEKIHSTSKGILIGTAAHGLIAFDEKIESFENIISRNSDNIGIFVRDILEYGDDEYWLATESGIFIYSTSTGSITNLRKNYHNPYSLSDNAVYTLCKDKEGGLWAGTFFGGINYYSRRHGSFQKYFPDDSKNSISGNAVREIVKDDYGNLWVGTEDAGLNRIDNKGVITHFIPTGNKNNISYYNIHGLLPVKDKLWVGTFEHGLDILDARTGKVLRHFEAGAGANALKSNFVFSIYQTRAGEILVGTTAGVFKYRPLSDDFTAIPQLNGYTYNILEDRNGVLWTATISDGIKFLNPRTGATGNYQYEVKNKNSISNNMVNSLFEDSHGNLWIATEGGGACKLSADRKTFSRYNTSNGLPSNFIFKVLEDDHQNLWITTAKGLVRLNPVSNKTVVYTSANGLLSDQFNYNSGFKDASGALYFGSVKGMIRFHPDNLTRNTFVPPVYFTGFQVQNRELSVSSNSFLKESVVYTRSINLPYNQSSFSIDFAALSYAAPQMNTYAYKMEGIDKGWINLATNRKVYFTDLAPGTYTFKVKAANSSGIWNPQEASLTITILPPWWSSPLAYALYIAAGMILLYLLIHSYHLRMRKQNQQKIDLLHFEKEKEIYEAKMKFFTNIAHEIRTPLTLIKGPLERVIRKAEVLPEIKSSLAIMERNTNRLIELTNQLLDYRQTEAGGFRLSFTEENISQLLEETFCSFRPLAEQRELAYVLELPATPLVAYADGEAVTKICSNLLSNAVKYAASSVVVQLVAHPGDDNFRIIVMNDGPLIPEEMTEKIFQPFVRLRKSEKQKGTGIGLALARSLTELHHGKLYVKTDEQLNCFVLTLPVYQERPLYNDLAVAIESTKPNSNFP